MILFFSYIFILFFLNSNASFLESRIYVLPLTEISLESASSNPLEPRPSASTLPRDASPSRYWDESRHEFATFSGNDFAQSSTSSLTSPLKGTIPKLLREETRSIPIPGRAQSHDDIRMFRVGVSSSSCCSSPQSTCFSPASPSGLYMNLCNSPDSSSPPVSGYDGRRLGAGTGPATVTRKLFYRATSPLSNSVPTGMYSSTSSRTISARQMHSSNQDNVAKTCGRSEKKLL